MNIHLKLAIVAVGLAVGAAAPLQAVDERDNRGVQAPRSTDPLDQRADELIRQLEA